MNRNTRRILKSEAANAAARLAGSCFDYTASGELVRVRDARAVDALERAFGAMLRQGCKPLVVQVETEAANAFPSGGQEAVPAAATSWLAVGIAREGRGTYSPRHLRIVACDRAKERALVELVMFGELGIELERGGFPIGQPMGRA